MISYKEEVLVCIKEGVIDAEEGYWMIEEAIGAS